MSKQTKLDYNDLLIVPAAVSDIKSRKEVYPFYDHINRFHLPLITAPMDTVANDKNSQFFLDLGINVCYPRHENPKFKMKEGVMEFESISLGEFERLINEESIKPNSNDGKYYVCVDVANGHMKFLHDLVRSAKEKFGESIVIMTGNIANPETYRILSECGADFIRCGIGAGCFIDGTEITTLGGYKKIEDIEIGDEVLTHTGNYKKVLNTKKDHYNGEMIQINDEITCTPDHLFYVLNKKHINKFNDESIQILCEWVSALELYNNFSDYLLIELNE